MTLQDTQTQTHKHTDRQTDRQTHTHTHTHTRTRARARPAVVVWRRFSICAAHENDIFCPYGNAAPKTQSEILSKYRPCTRGVIPWCKHPCNSRHSPESTSQQWAKDFCHCFPPDMRAIGSIGYLRRDVSPWQHSGVFQQRRGLYVPTIAYPASQWGTRSLDWLRRSLRTFSGLGGWAPLSRPGTQRSAKLAWNGRHDPLPPPRPSIPQVDCLELCFAFRHTQ